jgi:hypothetical protein
MVWDNGVLRCLSAAAKLRLFSGRGENPHRRYVDFDPRARERSQKPDFSEVSRSGERPEPTVIVRMKENGWKRVEQVARSYQLRSL